MPQLFNADEVFAMAIQMEDNGSRFYRAVAAKHEAAQDCVFLLKMAEMEDAHKLRFTDMRNKAAAQPAGTPSFDMYNEGGLYLAAIADGARTEGSPRVLEEISGKESLADILRISVDLEKQAILFYLGIKDLVPADLGRDLIDGIIKEEQSHVVMLMEELKKIEG